MSLISFKSLISSFLILSLLSVYFIFAQGCCKVCLLADIVIKMFSMLQYGRLNLRRRIIDRNKTSDVWPWGKNSDLSLFSRTREHYLEGEAACICYVSTSKMSAEAQPSLAASRMLKMSPVNEHTETLYRKGFWRGDTQNEGTDKKRALV